MSRKRSIPLITGISSVMATASVIALLSTSGAEARRSLLPAQPSVEINLDVIDALIAQQQPDMNQPFAFGQSEAVRRGNAQSSQLSPTARTPRVGTPMRSTPPQDRRRPAGMSAAIAPSQPVATNMPEGGVSSRQFRRLPAQSSNAPFSRLQRQPREDVARTAPEKAEEPRTDRRVAPKPAPKETPKPASKPANKPAPKPVEPAPAPEPLPEPDIDNMIFKEFEAKEAEADAAIVPLPDVSEDDPFEMPTFAPMEPEREPERVPESVPEPIVPPAATSPEPLADMPEMPAIAEPDFPEMPPIPQMNEPADLMPSGAIEPPAAPAEIMPELPSFPPPATESDLGRLPPPSAMFGDSDNPGAPADANGLPPLSAITGSDDEFADDPLPPAFDDLPPMEPVASPPRAQNDMPMVPDMPELPQVNQDRLPPMQELASLPGEMPPPPRFSSQPSMVPSAPVSPGADSAPASGGSEKLTIEFAATENDIPVSAQAELNALAQRLRNGTSKLTIRPFVGGTAEEAALANAIGTRRAFSIRTYLIDQGVSHFSISIDRNQVTKEGNPERVELIVN